MTHEQAWEYNRQGMRQLQQRARDLFESLMPRSLTARPGCEYLLPFAGSWVRYIQYAISAVRRLHDGGLGHFAAPIRRMIVEHAISLAMVERDPAAFNAFIRGLQDQTRRIQSALAKIDVPTEAELQAILEWETDPDAKHYDRFQAVKHRCEALGEMGDRLFVQWIEETMLSHANYATSVLFLRDTPGDDVPTLTLTAQVPVDDWKADAAIADAFILAVDVFSRMIVNDPLRDGIDDINRTKDELLDEAERLSRRPPP